MNLVFLDDKNAINPAEVVSLEDYDHYSSLSPSSDPRLQYSGVIIILKNGRKVFIKNLTAKEAYENLIPKN